MGNLMTIHAADSLITDQDLSMYVCVEFSFYDNKYKH